MTTHDRREWAFRKFRTPGGGEAMVVRGNALAWSRPASHQGQGFCKGIVGSCHKKIPPSRPAAQGSFYEGFGLQRMTTAMVIFEDRAKAYAGGDLDCAGPVRCTALRPARATARWHQTPQGAPECTVQSGVMGHTQYIDAKLLFIVPNSTPAQNALPHFSANSAGRRCAILFEV